MTIESEFDNMINIPFSVVIRQNKKNVIMIIGVIFCNHCHWNLDFSHSFTQGKKKTKKQILSASQGIEIFRFKGKTVRRTG